MTIDRESYHAGLRKAAEICAAKREGFKDFRLGASMIAAERISVARQIEKAILAEVSREEAKTKEPGK